MVIIKTSALVADIRGIVGGNVFSSNKGGNYTRRYKKPINRNTTAQQTMRNLFMTLSAGWRNLEDSEREAWNTIAPHYPYMDSLGQSKVLSGQQLYMKLNQQIQGYNAAGSTLPFALLTTPAEPQPFPTQVITQGQFDFSTTSLLLNNMLFDDLEAVPAGFGLIIEATQVLSYGITAPQKGLFKNIISWEPGTDVTDAGNATDTGGAYTAVFGLPAVGSMFYVQISLISQVSGEKSVASRARYIVVP